MKKTTSKGKPVWDSHAVAVGERLRECRKTFQNEDGTTGLTQSQLADMVNDIQQGDSSLPVRECSSTQIGFIESGARSLSRDYADLFAEALGVRPEYLLMKCDYKTLDDTVVAFENAFQAYKDRRITVEFSTQRLIYALIDSLDYELLPGGILESRVGDPASFLSNQDLDQLEDEILHYTEYLTKKYIEKNTGRNRNG